MKKIGALLWMVGFTWSAQAGGLESLENFVKSARSGRAEFTQVVTAPVREGQPQRTKTSSGTFEFSRPDRFRFDYRKPFEQTIVADGRTLWLHDVDLNQVTARAQSQVLGTAPAALIAASSDLTALRRDFNLEPGAERDGLEWVKATPKARDAQLQSVSLGFRGNDLAVLEILDGFGQRSVMRFTKMDLNVALPPATFQFKPPPGADLLRQ